MKTIKKTFKTLFVFLLTLSLCGCNQFRDYVEPEEQYLISAIGFDSEENEIIMSAEVIIIKQEIEKSETESRIFTGRGKTVGTAYLDLSESIANTLVFGHCGIFALGDSLSRSQITEIFELFYRETEITFDSHIISCKNAEELLNTKSISTPVIAYDLMGVIEQKTNNWKLNYTSRIYEVEKRNLSKNSLYTVPYFTCEDDKYRLYGLKIYKDNQTAAIIDNEESLIYTIIRNSYGGGEFSFSYDGEVYTANVRKSDTKNRVKFEDGLKIEINNDMVFRYDRTYNSPPDLTKEKLKERIYEFTKKYLTDGNDIFGFSNKIPTDSKEERTEFLKEAEITVNCNISERRG